MKHILRTCILMMLLACTACGMMSETRQERAEREQREALLVQQFVESANFKIDITQMIPFRGRPQHVSPFSVSVKDGKINSYLPYFGRAWDLPYGGGHGLNFQAEYQEYNVIAQPDGSDMIRILVKTDEDTHVYTFTIYDNGKVNLLVQSRNREPVSYYGEIRFSDDEDN